MRYAGPAGPGAQVTRGSRIRVFPCDSWDQITRESPLARIEKMKKRGRWTGKNGKTNRETLKERGRRTENEVDGEIDKDKVKK